MTSVRKIAGTVLLSAVFLVTGCGQGQTSQNFTLPDLRGQSVSLESLLKENKAILLNFWATWCPPCREEIPDLIRLQEQYGGKGFTVVGVDVGESRAKVAAFAERMGMNYPILLDSDQSVSESYRVVGIPTSLLMRSDGTVIGKFHAAGPDLFEAVEAALQ
ncbi:MAG: TlpA family protein disulfide reductase [Candidatus Omnitrophica bacterium]|nr:TlpA family protein disulfide reductase [Candidatus Omnitrophota bacterium]